MTVAMLLQNQGPGKRTSLGWGPSSGWGIRHGPVQTFVCASLLFLLFSSNKPHSAPCTSQVLSEYSE